MSAPVESPSHASSTDSPVPDIILPPFSFPPSLSSHAFGSAARSSLFDLRPGTTFVNHGSYGVVPSLVSTYHKALLSRVESHPDLWFRLHSFPLTRAALRSFASLLHVDEADLVFVNNATTAVNAVLLSLDLAPGDVIVTPDLTYGACKLAMQRVAERTGARYEEFPIPLPCTADGVVRCVEAFLDAHKDWKIRFALFDVITSPTAMVMPYAAVCGLCAERGIPSMLDAAHALGQVDVEPLTSNAAFLTTNCHKWSFAPKGSALLWAHPSFSPLLHPVVTSHHLRDSLALRFWMQGTRDDTAFISAAAGLAFYQALGMQRVRDYNEALADWAVQYLAEQFGVSPDPLYPRSMAAPFLRVLELPISLPAIGDARVRSQFGNRLLERLMVERDVVAAFFVYADKVWLRISAQVYNEKADYERLAAVILELRDKGQ